MKQKCNVKIDGNNYSFDVDGDFFWGENELLFIAENSMISNADWGVEGYSCMKFFEVEEFQSLKKSILSNIKKALKICYIDFNEKTFNLDNYHQVVTNDELHNKVINITRNLTNEDFDFNIDKITRYLGDLLGVKLTSWIEGLNKTHIQIRINRPHSLDINPPHRDGYLSYYKEIINIWIPIENCNKETSLPIIPRSHLIPENNVFRTESKGARINKNLYHVPCILKTKSGTLNMIRPNPKEGEGLVFTPYLIHGAAINNSDRTRVSLELRFSRANSYRNL